MLGAGRAWWQQTSGSFSQSFRNLGPKRESWSGHTARKADAAAPTTPAELSLNRTPTNCKQILLRSKHERMNYRGRNSLPELLYKPTTPCTHLQKHEHHIILEVLFLISALENKIMKLANPQLSSSSQMIWTRQVLSD